MVKMDDLPGGVQIHDVRVETWQRLCDVAAQFRKLAPWRWMSEEEVFGVRLPGTDRIGFVCIMGEVGEHLACGVYLGWEALRRLKEVFDGRDMTFRDIVEIPQLQMSFEDRRVLTAEERALLRGLRRSYRGRQAWPVFRSHRPGYLPWLVEQQEAEWLLVAATQAMGVAMRCEDDPGLLVPEQEGTYLVLSEGRDGAWSEEWLPIPEPEPRRRPPETLDPVALESLRRMGPSFKRLQVDLSLSRTLIGRRGERPQTAYLLAILDADSGFCLGAEMVQALDGVEEMWAAVPGRVVTLLVNAGGYPREIEVAGDEMMGVLRTLSERLPCRLTRRARLDQVESFRESMDQFYNGSAGNR